MSALGGKKVLVLGGLGFMGSSTAVEMVRRGAKVTVYDALLPGYGGNLYNVDEVRKQISVLKKDVRDAAALNKAVKGQDLVFNFAAQVAYIDSLKDPLKDLDINVKGHLLLLEACRNFNREARVFFMSSRFVYGKDLMPKIAETHPTKPLNMYGIHKLACEQYMELYWREFKVPSTVFRVLNPYGPRQQMIHSKYSLIGWFIRQAMEDKAIRIFGDGAQKRDYIYIDDLVSAFIAVAEKDLGGYNCFNLGTGTGVPFKTMVELVVKTVGRGRVEHVEWPKDYENIETGSAVADMSKLHEVVRWAPRVGIEEGIRKTYEYYRRHQARYWKMGSANPKSKQSPQKV